MPNPILGTWQLAKVESVKPKEEIKVELFTVTGNMAISGDMPNPTKECIAKLRLISSRHPSMTPQAKDELESIAKEFESIP